MTKLPSEGFGLEERTFAGLRKYFFYPPFSILRTMDAEWQKKKRRWMKLGIKSEVGRSTDLAYNSSVEAWFHKGPTAIQNGEEWRGCGKLKGEGTSVFDPVLCQLMYQWFCPPGGQVIDPFAGGSVRGIVAHVLGLQYWGCELREEQVEANRQQAQDIMPDNPPTWVCGDSAKEAINAPYADMIFSCPPYGNLEVYSDDPADLSNMEYKKFRRQYHQIIADSVSCLRDDRFAVYVVQSFRDTKTHYYHDLVGDTIRCFEKEGMGFYNEAILLTAVGTLPIRAGKYFRSSRKLGKGHQNVLVFFKGDIKTIKENYPEVTHESETG